MQSPAHAHAIEVGATASLPSTRRRSLRALAALPGVPRSHEPLLSAYVAACVAAGRVAPSLYFVQQLLSSVCTKRDEHTLSSSSSSSSSSSRNSNTRHSDTWHSTEHNNSQDCGDVFVLDSLHLAGGVTARPHTAMLRPAARLRARDATAMAAVFSQVRVMRTITVHGGDIESLLIIASALASHSSSLSPLCSATAFIVQGAELDLCQNVAAAAECVHAVARVAVRARRFAVRQCTRGGDTLAAHVGAALRAASVGGEPETRRVRLRALAVASCALSAHGCAALVRALADAPPALARTLRSLNFNDNAIECDGATMLAAWVDAAAARGSGRSECRGVAAPSVHLARNRVRDIGAAALFSRAHKMHTLDVRENAFSARALRVLVESLRGVATSVEAATVAHAHTATLPLRCLRVARSAVCAATCGAREELGAQLLEALGELGIGKLCELDLRHCCLHFQSDASVQTLCDFIGQRAHSLRALHVHDLNPVLASAPQRHALLAAIGRSRTLQRISSFTAIDAQLKESAHDFFGLCERALGANARRAERQATSDATLSPLRAQKAHEFNEDIKDFNDFNDVDDNDDDNDDDDECRDYLDDGNMHVLCGEFSSLASAPPPPQSNTSGSSSKRLNRNNDTEHAALSPSHDTHDSPLAHETHPKKHSDVDIAQRKLRFEATAKRSAAHQQYAMRDEHAAAADQAHHAGHDTVVGTDKVCCNCVAMESRMRRLEARLRVLEKYIENESSSNVELINALLLSKSLK